MTSNKVMNFKEYFKTLDRLRQLIANRKLISDKVELIKTDIEIMNLELKTSDYTYEIDNYLDDSEREYIKLKYIDKQHSAYLQTVFCKSQSTLSRYEKSILDKLN